MPRSPENARKCPSCKSKQISFLQVRGTDGIIEMPHGHPPVMAYKPFHGRWADQLDEGKLEGLGQRLHDVGANVIHGALLDEGLKEPAMIQHDPTPRPSQPQHPHAF